MRWLVVWILVVSLTGGCASTDDTQARLTQREVLALKRIAPLLMSSEQAEPQSGHQLVVMFDGDEAEIPAPWTKCLGFDGRFALGRSSDAEPDEGGDDPFRVGTPGKHTVQMRAGSVEKLPGRHQDWENPNQNAPVVPILRGSGKKEAASFVLYSGWQSARHVKHRKVYFICLPL